MPKEPHARVLNSQALLPKVLKPTPLELRTPIPVPLWSLKTAIALSQSALHDPQDSKRRIPMPHTPYYASKYYVLNPKPSRCHRGDRVKFARDSSRVADWSGVPASRLAFNEGQAAGAKVLFLSLLLSSLFM